MAEIIPFQSRRLDPRVVECAVAQAQQRIEGGRSDRLAWWAHWAQCAENYLSRRYKWFISPNQTNRGAQMNQNIIDETGLLSARILAAGLLSGLTSPTKPWFRLGFEDLGLVAFGPVRDWLAEVERRMLRVLARSNFYTSMGQFYHDEVVFGSACLFEYEDRQDVIRFTNPCLGEFFFFSSPRNDVGAVAREYTYTVSQTVGEFGLANCSDSIRQLFKSGGAAMTREIVVNHIIEPNLTLFEGGTTPLPNLVPPSFPWREIYWEKGQNEGKVLRAAGFKEQPFMAGRWDVTSNDAYGRCPGMDGLPAQRQLQVERKRKGEFIDKGVRPPMVGHVSMKNEPKSILPGDVTYVVDMANGKFQPAFMVEPNWLQPLSEDIKEVQDVVKSIFFVDLFMMISQLDTVRTATEIDARREEKLIQLGPVVERSENEVLDKVIDRTFGIMSRRRLLPQAPREIAGQNIQVQYVSMLAEAQRAASTAAIERLLGLAGNLSGIKPEAIDNIDVDEAIDEYADLLGTSPRIIVPTKKVLALRAARAQQQQQMQQAQLTMAGTEAAKNLAATKVGEGNTALDKIMGTG